MEFLHDKQGNVRPGAYFFGNVILHPNDPAIPQRYEDDPYQSSPDDYAEEQVRRRNRPTELERYYDAKQAGTLSLSVTYCITLLMLFQRSRTVILSPRLKSGVRQIPSNLMERNKVSSGMIIKDTAGETSEAARKKE